MLLAKNAQGDILELVKQFTSSTAYVYRFQIEYAGQVSFISGQPYSTKQLALNDAREFALSALCGCFKESDLVSGLPTKQTFELSQDEKTSLGVAYLALESGTEQQQIAAFYIKQLINKAK